MLIYYVISPFAIYLSGFLFYYFLTKFKREIKVCTKYTQLMEGSRLYYVFDEHMEQYSIETVMFIMGDDECAKTWHKIDEGSSIVIEGYGIRMNYFDIFPKIIKVVK